MGHNLERAFFNDVFYMCMLCEKDKQAVQKLETKIRTERQSCGEKVKSEKEK